MSANQSALHLSVLSLTDDVTYLINNKTAPSNKIHKQIHEWPYGQVYLIKISSLLKITTGSKHLTMNTVIIIYISTSKN